MLFADGNHLNQPVPLTAAGDPCSDADEGQA